MLNKLSGWDDTIVALATPPGIGALAIIRLSGPASFQIIDVLFPSKKLSLENSHTLHHGFLKQDGSSIDDVVVSLFRGPRSYTGEDIIEISCHGSPYIQEQIIQACCNKGARVAKPGEFTQRAFLNGKLDLTQAEAVADLISSNTAAAQRTALHDIRGRFSEELQLMRKQLIEFASLIELELDFAAEDVEFADRVKFYNLVTSITDKTAGLIESFRLGNVIKNGISVAIIGKPNAGKSTLLNRLLNENRAIVSEIAGTTRDTIEEIVNIHGIQFRIIDTAGIRAHSIDEIELIGMGKSLEKMRSADLVLYIFDINTELAEHVNEEASRFRDEAINYLLVGNKAEEPDNMNEFENTDTYFISAKHNIGIEMLKTGIYKSTVTADLASEHTIITNSRHYEALKQMEVSLNDIKAGLDNKISGDLLAPDIRRCLYYLGEITGEITNEDILDFIFSKFCIGK
ncbi:MAG: tRNA uridine-5-carboxymethylaminomethyl(34) synthesis GTPase MnmE [Ferruginibacter sp.]